MRAHSPYPCLYPLNHANGKKDVVVPPHMSVAQYMGYLKSKSSLKEYAGPFTGTPVKQGK